MGLVCSNGYGFQPGTGCNVSHLQIFTNATQLRNSAGAQFFYNYQLSAPSAMKVWMSESGVEFVPMVGWRHLWLDAPGAPSHHLCTERSSKSECRCYFTSPLLAPASAPGRDGPFCLASDLVAALRHGISGLSGRAKPRYLMGFQQPEDARASHKNISAEEAVDYWRRFLQPAAQELNLSLVTPTISQGTCRQHAYGCRYTGTWYANFLKACWDRRESAEYPCNVEKIAAVSVHLYKCMEDSWTSMFRPGTGQFFKDMKAQMKDYGGRSWDEFIDSRKIWVTEFNCDDDHVGLGLPDVLPVATVQDTCRRLMGQAEALKAHGGRAWHWGGGAVRALEALASVERYAWRHAWRPGRQVGLGPDLGLGAPLVDDAGAPQPHGLALLRGLEGVDCAAPSARAVA